MITKQKLPECNDRVFEKTSNGLGGYITGIMTPCCTIIKIHPGNINCNHILRVGKCPHKFDYEHDSNSYDPSTFKVSDNFKKELELEEKTIKEDEKLLEYLNEIDPGCET